MKILFVTHPYPNYCPDLLLQGLRKLLGPDVVDYPRKDCLYQGVLGLGVCPEDQLCPGWFPDDRNHIDREHIADKVAGGYFKYIVCDCRAIPWLLEHLPDRRARLVLIDGEDRPARIPLGNYIICRRETNGADFSLPLPMALPEEILQWIMTDDHLPKEYSIGFLGSTNDGRRRKIVEEIERFYPNTLFQTTNVPSAADSCPQGRLSRRKYYRQLQKCRIVLSLSWAGYDTFRFWENAACNAVHLAFRFPLYIPNDFTDNQNILRFDHPDELRRKIDPILDNFDKAREMIRNGRRHLVTYHLTTGRAEYL
jgi:hypothetical protein